MATLGTQNISTTFPQVLKTFGSNIVDGTLRAIASGDEAGVSALQISTTGAKSTGTFAVDGATTLTGAVTFGGSITASTGTATIGTLSASTATISTATISMATVSTATIPTILGATTFGSNITASTGTATIGTISVNTATVGTLDTLNGLSVTTTATFGTARITGSTGGVSAINYGTASFTLSTVPTNGSTTGTFGINGLSLNDIVHGSLNSIGSATGSQALSFFVFAKAANVAQYTLCNVNNTTISTVPAGTVYATAIRMVT